MPDHHFNSLSANPGAAKSRFPSSTPNPNIVHPDLLSAFHRYSRLSPKLFNAIHGRKFLLPSYRQPDYAPQDILNQWFSEQLHCAALGLFGYGDDVSNSQWACMVSALGCGRPILFLERELGEALLRTKMLLGMQTSDIRWRWPSVRVYLPQGLLAIVREGQPRSALYIDIAHVPIEGVYMPKVYADEIEANISKSPYAASPTRRSLHKLSFKMDDAYIATALAIDYSELGLGPTLYAFTAPWTNHTLGQITSYEHNMHTALVCDVADDAFLDRMKLLTLNILTFISSVKLTYTSDIVRRARMEGKHLKPELAKAVFVGQSQIRSEYTNKRPPGQPTGRSIAGHWVMGHWRRRRAADGWDQDTNLIWIQPYQTTD
jgi:hypothetical protein